MTASISVSATSSECCRRTAIAPCGAVRRHLPLICHALLLLALLASATARAAVYEHPDAFIARVFDGAPPVPSLLYPDQALKADIRAILGHRYPKFRIRYWLRGGRSAWILEEIGKEKPITVGLVIAAAGIEETKVLVYRESRGQEVRRSAFTRQFKGARLEAGKRLDRRIDGITGATLSVRALTRLARLALLLHDHVSNSPLSGARLN